MLSVRTSGSEIAVVGPPVDRVDEAFSPAVLEFLTHLHLRFRHAVRAAVDIRAARYRDVLAGGALAFPAPSSAAPSGPWHVAEAPPDLTDRRVEIAGPVTPKLGINALNSGAQVWIADLEDALTPSWHNIVVAHTTLVDAVHKRLAFDGADGRGYRLAERTAAIVVRPRGLHMLERHVLVDGEPMSASLVDFGVYFFHCARELLRTGSGPYFYLPKVENSVDAQLWENVFCFAQDAMGIPRGSIRAAVIIETVTAAFEMPEILYALRQHSAGLTAGRWDYLFSMIKNFRNRREFVLPERGVVTMTVPFLKSYTDLLIHTCHRHAAHAIGGVAAAVPSRSDREASARAHRIVREDKRREAAEGFDGAWVVHPDLVATCSEPFAVAFCAQPHQIHRTPEVGIVTAEDLLAVDRTPGDVTPAGLRSNIAVSLRYLSEWLAGNGSARIFGLMEGLATVEIARSQVWQWIHHGIPLTDGATVTAAMVRTIMAEELAAYRSVRASGRDSDLEGAWRLFELAALTDDFPEFLTDHSYPKLIAMERLADASTK
jgi:malate synthase